MTAIAVTSSGGASYIDPESILVRNEIVKLQNISSSSTKMHINDEIIIIDDDDDDIQSDKEAQASHQEDNQSDKEAEASDQEDNQSTKEISEEEGQETLENSFQTEFEKLIQNSDGKLQILKETPHDDKENQHNHRIETTINQFRKRPRGRPSTKEIKAKTRNIHATVIEMASADSTSTVVSNKPFNITLGFLGPAKKTRSTRDRVKKFKNSIRPTESNHSAATTNTKIRKRKRTTKIGKKRGRRPRNIQVNSPNQNQNMKSDEQLQAEIVAEMKQDNFDGMNMSLYANNNVIEIIDSDEEIILNQEITIPDAYTDTLKLPLIEKKRKRGRPVGAVKPKIKKPPGQIGRPLLQISHEIGAAKETTVVRTPLKRGRPAGPPKPPKVPGKRGRKPKNGLSPVQKSPKVPGRGRGRPSFESMAIIARQSQKLPNPSGSAAQHENAANPINQTDDTIKIVSEPIDDEITELPDEISMNKHVEIIHYAKSTIRKLSESSFHTSDDGELNTSSKVALTNDKNMIGEDDDDDIQLVMEQEHILPN